jgi:hypothetical protein
MGYLSTLTGTCEIDGIGRATPAILTSFLARHRP